MWKDYSKLKRELYSNRWDYLNSVKEKSIGYDQSRSYFIKLLLKWKSSKVTDDSGKEKAGQKAKGSGSIAARNFIVIEIIEWFALFFLSNVLLLLTNYIVLHSASYKRCREMFIARVAQLEEHDLAKVGEWERKWKSRLHSAFFIPSRSVSLSTSSHPLMNRK